MWIIAMLPRRIQWTQKAVSGTSSHQRSVMMVKFDRQSKTSL